MPKPLTAEQLDALRAMPLGEMPNKVRVALALVQAKQAELVNEGILDAPHLSRIVNGDYVHVTVATARKLASFFGCQIEDLFPARDSEGAACR